MGLSHLWVSYKEAPAAFVLDCLCKDVCIANSLGRQRHCLPIEQSAGMLSVQYNKDNVFFCRRGQDLWTIIKYSGSLSSGFLPCNVTHCSLSCHLALFALTYGNWSSGNPHKNMYLFSHSQVWKENDSL